jgi:NADH-quinone oxidoreductase subunit A
MILNLVDRVALDRNDRCFDDDRSAAGEGVPEMPFRLYDYLPILLMFIVAGRLRGGQRLLPIRRTTKRTRTKLMPYECGKDPVGSARERFSVKFYLIAMIFILFDIEVIFLVPWAVVFKTLRSPAYGCERLFTSR